MKNSPYPSILSLLEGKSIFDLTISEDRKVANLQEQCDNHFDVNLTKQELLQLSEEIKKLAEGMID